MLVKSIRTPSMYGRQFHGISIAVNLTVRSFKRQTQKFRSIYFFWRTIANYSCHIDRYSIAIIEEIKKKLLPVMIKPLLNSYLFDINKYVYSKAV